MRLIDADAIIIDLLDRGIEGVQTDDYAEFRQIVEDAPTVDAVSVVRCSECKYNNACFTQSFVESEGVLPFDRNTWYCADGERKGGDE